MGEAHDRKHQPGEIAVGTQVLLENTAQKQRKGGKLEPAWLGPYSTSIDALVKESMRKDVR